MTYADDLLATCPVEKGLYSLNREYYTKAYYIAFANWGFSASPVWTCSATDRFSALSEFGRYVREEVKRDRDWPPPWLRLYRKG